MRSSPSDTWKIVAIASAAAAVASAILAVLSVIDGEIILAVISGVSAAVLIACTAVALSIYRKISEIERINGQVTCIVLKKEGIEPAQSGEIVPKGKMPKE